MKVLIVLFVSVFVILIFRKQISMYFALNDLQSEKYKIVTVSQARFLKRELVKANKNRVEMFRMLNKKISDGPVIEYPLLLDKIIDAGGNYKVDDFEAGLLREIVCFVKEN